MANVVIVYHSGYGHARLQAEHVLKGAAGVSAKLVTTDEAVADLAQFDPADAIVFGCPTYMGGPSAQFKTFISRRSSTRPAKSGSGRGGRTRSRPGSPTPAGRPGTS